MSLNRKLSDLSFVSPNLRSQAVVERAFKGSSADQFNLATNYLEGSNGFHKSSERGVYWLTQAVNGGEVVALNQLGLCYLEGNGAIKDEKLAYQMIKLGADKGDVTAMVNAAMLSTNGCGTSVDYRLAADLLHEAAAQRYGPAAYQLGKMYLHGWGVNQDGYAALQSFTLAADEGVLEAHSGLAQCYTDGIGTPVDLERAKHHWMTASWGGDVVAQRCVGERLLEGSAAFTVDHKEARRYLERAATAGDSQAQYRLALCCGNGTGGPQDLAARDLWLNKAVAQRHAAAVTEKHNILMELGRIDDESELNTSDSSANTSSDSSHDLGNPNARHKWRTFAKRLFHRRPTSITGSAAL